MKTNTVQKGIGFAVLILIIVGGIFGAYGDDVTAFPRLLIGIAIGYVLSRGAFGFAGMATRTFRTGNADLITGMMITVVITSMAVGGILIAEHRLGVDIISLSTHAITWGLFLGGLLFGIGMAFSSCCATGVLQEMVQDPIRAFVTILFFATGVLLGFPVGNLPIAKQAIIGTDAGVSFLNIFPGDGTGGVFTAIIVTILLASIGVYFALRYEKTVKSAYPEVHIAEPEEYNTLYEKLFVKPYTMMQTTLGLSILIALIFLVRGKGWSASSVIGYWLATILNKLGVSATALSDYAERDVVIKVFQDPSSLQNIGIILGTLLALLLAGKYIPKVQESFKKRPMELILFAIGGLLMGFGTRLSAGCNVGAFLTPAVGFSLSGWLYLIVLISAGYLGNRGYKLFYKWMKK